MENIPNIDRFIRNHAQAVTRSAELQQSLLAAREQVQALEATSKSALSRVSANVTQFKQSIGGAPQLYGASFALDHLYQNLGELTPDTILRSVEHMHRRGVLLCSLAEVVKEEEQPVVEFRFGSEDLGAGDIVMSIDAIIGRVAENGLQLETEDTVNSDTLMRTSTPQRVVIQVVNGMEVGTRTVGFDDARVLRDPNSSRFEERHIGLLNRYVESNAFNYDFTDVTSAENNRWQLQRNLSLLFIGASATEDAYRQLQEVTDPATRDFDYDVRAFEKVAKELSEFN